MVDFNQHIYNIKAKAGNPITKYKICTQHSRAVMYLSRVKFTVEVEVTVAFFKQEDPLIGSN